MTTAQELREEGLLPWQAEAAARVLESAPGSAFQIVAPGAAGKSTLARAIVRRTLAADPGSRVLVTCPAALAASWRHQLDGLAAPPRILDLDTVLDAEERDDWPDGTIQVISVDVMKRPDVARYALDREWSLLISESVPPVTPRRRELLERAIASGRFGRVVVLTTFAIPDAGSLVTYEAHREEILDGAGRPLFGPEPDIAAIPFRRGEGECLRLNELHALIDRIVERYGLPALFRDVTLAAAHSSPPSREETLARILAGGRTLRIRAGLAGQDTHWSLHDAFPHTWDVVAPEEVRRPLPAVDLAELDDMLAAAEGLLAACEDCGEEPKLDALVEAVAARLDEEPEARLALAAAFPTTAHYLESIGPDLATPVLALRAGQSLAERLATVATHRDSGGVLVVPDAAGQDLALEYVDELIAFDLPLSGAEAERRLTRFDRPGRSTPLRSAFLADETPGLHWRPSWPAHD